MVGLCRAQSEWVGLMAMPRTEFADLLYVIEKSPSTKILVLLFSFAPSFSLVVITHLSISEDVKGYALQK